MASVIPSGRIEKCLVWGIKSLIFLVPFSAIYISPSMVFPFITGKNFAFRIFIEFAAALWLGLIAVNRDYRIRNSSIVLSILVFTFIVGLADLLGVNPYKSFWSNYERMEGFITILHLALYFMIVRSVFTGKKEWNTLLFMFLLAGVSVSCSALLLPLDGSSLSFRRFAVEYGTRAFGTIGNPTFLAAYLLLSIFTAIILFINTQRRSLQIVCVLTILFHTAIIYLTGSRGAVLAGAGGIMLGLFMILWGKNVSLKKRAAFLIICAVIAVSVVFSVYHYNDFPANDRTASRFARMFSDPSVKSRIIVWKMSLNGIKERPLLGWGQENFAGIYTVNPIPLDDSHQWLDRAHNIILDWLVNAGFLGLFAYLAIFVSASYVIWAAYHKQAIKKFEAALLVSTLVVYFVQNLFIFDSINTYIIFFTLLAYTDNLESSGNPTDTYVKNNITKNVNVIKPVGVALMAFMICIPLFYYLNYKPIRQCQLFIRISKSITDRASFPALPEAISNALSLNSFGNSYIRQNMMSMSEIILREGFIEEKWAVPFIKATTGQVMEEIAIQRFDLEYLSGIIKWYYRIAHYEPAFTNAAEELVRGCIRLNPEYQWPYMIMTEILILKKDYEGAFAHAGNIAGMDPQNDKKQFMLALAAIYASRNDVANDSLERVTKIRMLNNRSIRSGSDRVFTDYESRQLIEGYKETENYQEALQHLNEISTKLNTMIASKYSENLTLRKAELHMEIAGIYQKLGDRENAAREAKEAADLDPAHFEDDVKAFID